MYSPLSTARKSDRNKQARPAHDPAGSIGDKRDGAPNGHHTAQYGHHPPPGHLRKTPGMTVPYGGFDHQHYQTLPLHRAPHHEPAPGIPVTHAPHMSFAFHQIMSAGMTRPGDGALPDNLNGLPLPSQSTQSSAPLPVNSESLPGAQIENQLYPLGDAEIHGPELLEQNLNGARRRRKASRLSVDHRSPTVSPVPVSAEDTESELKRIAVDSLRFPIERAAAHVREDESGPIAEKSRHVFGMSFLMRFCEDKPGSNIPRNRVYARYVTICTEYDLKPLNPASFGKLVHIVFPAIKTRRLGVRGQSKYHYCGLMITGELDDAAATPNGSMITTASPGSPCNVDFSGSHSAATSEYYGTPVPPTKSTSRAESPGVPGLDASRWLSPKLVPPDELILPDIKKFLTEPYDSDIATTLYGLYKAHCRAMIPHLRGLQVKKFIKVFSSFVGSLTLPARRLLTRSDATEWMVASDQLLFHQIIELMAPLCLQPLSREVHTALRSVVVSLPQQILQLSSAVSEAFAQAKLEVVKPFLRLLNRLVRANETASHALVVFNNAHGLAGMRNEWVARVTDTAELEAPCATELVGRIIKEEVPQLLENAISSAAGQGDGNKGPGGTEAFHDWVQYLAQLQRRFPAVHNRLFLIAVSAVLTAALRDLSMSGSESFGSWWALRCWIDEWLAWTTEFEEYVNPAGGVKPESGHLADIPLTEEGSPSQADLAH